MAALVLAQPEMMVPARDTWQHAGLACAILPSPLGGWNGYVQLPPGSRWRHHPYRTIPTPRSLTYGPDPDGWIGFDTGGGFDVWAADDDHPPYPPSWAKIPPAEIPEVVAQLQQLRHLLTATTQALPAARVWTLPRLRSEINRLARWAATSPGPTTDPDDDERKGTPDARPHLPPRTPRPS